MRRCASDWIKDVFNGFIEISSVRVTMEAKLKTFIQFLAAWKVCRVPLGVAASVFGLPILFKSV